jgi:hypothetical protein
MDSSQPEREEFSRIYVDKIKKNKKLEFIRLILDVWLILLSFP